MVSVLGGWHDCNPTAPDRADPDGAGSAVVYDRPRSERLSSRLTQGNATGTTMNFVLSRNQARFSVGWIMVAVSAVAVGLAIVRHALMSWGAGEAITLAITVLLTANLCALFQSDRRHRFLVGFEICGWTYLALSLGSPLEEHLPTTRLLDNLHGRFQANRPPPIHEDFGEGFRAAQIHAESFQRAGHAAISLMFALWGGFAASVLVPARPEATASGPPDGSLLGPGSRHGTQPIAYRSETSGEQSTAGSR